MTSNQGPFDRLGMDRRSTPGAISEEVLIPYRTVRRRGSGAPQIERGEVGRVLVKRFDEEINQSLRGRRNRFLMSQITRIGEGGRPQSPERSR